MWGFPRPTRVWWDGTAGRLGRAVGRLLKQRESDGPIARDAAMQSRSLLPQALCTTQPCALAGERARARASADCGRRSAGLCQGG
jgi:hypothetical protein